MNFLVQKLVCFFGLGNTRLIGGLETEIGFASRKTAAALGWIIATGTATARMVGAGTTR